MTLQEAKLIKHTAWMNCQRKPKGATNEEADKLVPFVVSAVVYTAVLNGMMYDLIDSLKADKLYNDRAKKILRMLHHSANYAHNEIYRVFNDAIEGFGRLYNERYDRTSAAIEANMGLQGSEKYYNVVLALLRLIEKNNNACGRFRSPALVALQPFIRRVLDIGLPIADKGRAIEVIIESASKEVLQKRDFEKKLKDYNDGDRN